jgi:heme oxygenase
LADLHARLRTETAGLHDRLEALPFFRTLGAGQLPKPAIVSLLRCLAIIHAVLERELSQVSHRQVAALANSARPKVPLLLADLEAAGAEGVPSVTAALREALDLGGEILADAGDPPSLAGALYVLEGSQRGGLALKGAYVRCLGLPADGLSYFGCYGGGTAAHWTSFGKILDALGFDEEQERQAIAAAIRCFARLGKICAALYPYADADLRHHVTAVNFEAGDHAMPQDPREIAMALRAARAAWTKYPYLARRFGDRGKRFTDSDSCWLVALARMPAATAMRNLAWLRTVLASRGIPTAILEGHLHAIAREFAGQADKRAGFDGFLASLDAERQALGGAETISRVVDRFDRRFRGCAGRTVESASQLIASAWMDERAGIAGALAAVRDWFTDGERFSDDWIATVHALVAALDRTGGV